MSSQDVPAAIRARQHRNEQLRLRFLDSKERAIGKDYHALQAQIEAKKAAFEAEKERDRAYAAHVDHLHALAKDVDGAELDAAARDADMLRATWKVQRATPSDTADLNDPYALGRGAPPRTEHDTKGLGASSMQVFDGEFYDEAKHKADTKESLQAWNGALLADKAARAAAQRDADRAYAAFSADLVTAAEEAERGWDSEAKAAQRALLMAQKEQIRAARAAKAAAAAADREADRRHVAAQSAGLAEDRAAGFDATNPNRTRPDHWKGFSLEDLSGIQAQQQEQIAAKAAAEAARRAQDAAYAAYADECAAIAAAADAAAAEEAAEAQRAEMAFLKQQQREAARKRAREEAERKAPVDMYDGGFFGGFGRSHR